MLSLRLILIFSLLISGMQLIAGPHVNAGAKSSINWSLKSLVNNINKVHIKNELSNKRKAFFQVTSQQFNSPINNEQSISLKSSAARVPQTIDEKASDDLVLYDYSQPVLQEAKPDPQKNSLEIFKVQESLEPKESNDYVFDYSQTDQDVCKPDNSQKISHVSAVEILAESVSFEGDNYDVKNFEISFFDDRDEIVTSNFDGVAALGLDYILARSNPSRQIQLYSPEHYPISTKIDFSEERIEYKLPLISKESLNGLLEIESIPSFEGLLLVAVDDQTQNIFIDKPYKKRFYLSSEFRLTSADLSSYILYAGIDLGNLEITIENENDTIYKAIIHLRAEEVFYYAYEKSDADVLEVQVCQQELIGSARRRVSVSGSQIELFNNETLAEKININKYRIPRHQNIQSEKDYLVFKHLSEDIMLSNNNANYVELPSQSFLNYLISEFNINDVHCMVQFNFTNPIKSVIMEGYTSLGFLPMDIYYLDENGVFDSVVNDNTQKAYISAQGEGVIHARIEYANGSVDFTQSFCGPGSYSVEQL